MTIKHFGLKKTLKQRNKKNSAAFLWPFKYPNPNKIIESLHHISKNIHLSLIQHVQQVSSVFLTNYTSANAGNDTAELWLQRFCKNKWNKKTSSSFYRNYKNIKKCISRPRRSHFSERICFKHKNILFWDVFLFGFIIKRFF